MTVNFTKLLGLRFLCLNIFLIGVITVYSVGAAERISTQEPSPNILSCTDSGRIFDIAFSPDDQYLIASNWKNDVKDTWKSRVWDVKTGKVLWDLDNFATTVAFSPDGKYMVTANGTEVYFWDALTGKLIRKLPQDIKNHEAITLRFTSDSKYLVKGGNNGASVWDIASGERKNSFPGSLDFSLNQEIDVSLDGKFILTFGDENGTAEAYLYNVQTGEKVFTFEDTWMAKFSPDGIHISTRGREGLVIWDIPTLTKVVTYEIGLGRVYDWSFSNDGHYLLIDNITLWDTHSKQAKPILEFPGTELGTVYGILSDNQHVLISEGETPPYAVGIWDISSGAKIKSFQLDVFGIYTLAFTKDSRYVAVGTDYGEVQLWDIQEGRKFQSFC